MKSKSDWQGIVGITGRVSSEYRVGWGGDLEILRKHLPNTFLNIRLDPVTLNNYSEEELQTTIVDLIAKSGNPALTGICCINMDNKVEDSKITTIFKTVEKLRQIY